jgi:hypothetical protein
VHALFAYVFCCVKHHFCNTWIDSLTSMKCTHHRKQKWASSKLDDIQNLERAYLVLCRIGKCCKHIPDFLSRSECEQHDARNNLEVANRGMERARKELIDAENLVMAARTVSRLIAHSCARTPAKRIVKLMCVLDVQKHLPNTHGFAYSQPYTHSIKRPVSCRST